LKDLVGNVVDDDNGMCDMLNDFFGSVLTTENVADMPEVSTWRWWNYTTVPKKRCV